MADAARGYSGAYQRYVLRDLTYVSGGYLVALSAALCLWNSTFTKDAVAYVTGSRPLALLSLVAAYVVGVLVKETVENFFRLMQFLLENLVGLSSCDKARSCVHRHFFLIRTRPPARVGKFDNYVLLVDSLVKERGPHVLARLERDVFLFHLGAIIASCGFVSFLLLALSHIPNKNLFSALALLFAVAATIENYVKFRDWRTKLELLEAAGRE